MIRKLYRILRGKDFWMRPDVKLPMVRLGTSYGGWWVSSDHLEKNLNVISAGIGEDASFDRVLLSSYNANVYAIDPSPRACDYVANSCLGERFLFINKALAKKSGDISFCLPADPAHVSGSIIKNNSAHSINVKAVSLEDFLKDFEVNKVDIFKMDIEGAEYQIIESIVEIGLKPGQILIEYHHFFSEISLETSKKSIKLLRDYGYKIFSIEGYNYSFIKNDCIL